MISNTIYRRPDDMSATKEFQVLCQSDGDVCLRIFDTETGESMDIEFCASGGRSHNLLKILRMLPDAMDEDAMRWPYPEEAP